MAKYYYKSNKTNWKKGTRILGMLLFVVGLYAALYTFFPLLSWQLYFAPAFAAQDLAAPIPKTTIVNPSTIQSLLSNSQSLFAGTNYSDAQNWFPMIQIGDGAKPKVPSYTLSVPVLGIKEAVVSTQDYDLSNHLINYPGTGIPGENGTVVIFGHSTLPQLFDPKNYKAIFATAYRLRIGDTVNIQIDHATYTYDIFSITVVDPTDTSIFTQNYDNSYITIVTCTPPGTTWKRLIIKGRLQKL